jgi:carbon monoxide dehydrogenase subunit G
MRIEGQHTFTAPPEAVFAALVDPALVATTVPGLTDFRVESPTRWHGTVRLPVGPKIALDFELVELVEPSRARLVMRGKTFGGAVRVETAFDLEPSGTSATLMRYAVVGELSGLLGRLGDTALRPIGEQQVSGVLRAIEQHLATRSAG